jgi:hypothetical protein
LFLFWFFLGFRAVSGFFALDYFVFVLGYFLQGRVDLGVDLVPVLQRFFWASSIGIANAAADSGFSNLTGC